LERVQASLHHYLSTQVIPAQAGIQEGERKNFWIPACAGMTFWNREKSRVMWTRWCMFIIRAGFSIIVPQTIKAKSLIVPVIAQVISHSH
jgi:hypothetical protein